MSTVRQNLSATTHAPVAAFQNPRRAEANLAHLSAVGFPQDRLEALVRAALACADPDRAINNIERLVGGGGKSRRAVLAISQQPRVVGSLMTVLGASEFLADILARNPSLWRWLASAPDPDRNVKVQDRAWAAARRWIATASGTEDASRALRRYQRQELFRIGASDLLGRLDAEAVTAKLATLADRVVSETLELSARELAAQLGVRWPPAEKLPFAVVALGKWGGCELNFSSDIDALFTYDGEAARSLDLGGLVPQEAFARLGERLIALLTAPGDEGALYRVDMRLRPEGQSGTLVQSLEEMHRYYRTRSALWERQMLIKARPAAGNRKVGDAFVELVEPLVYVRAFTSFTPQEEIRRVREEIETHVGSGRGGERNVKLARGGIRDVEFIVQCLQLLVGSQKPQARCGNTFAALGVLKAVGSLSPDEAHGLREAYTFYRNLEHRLQMVHGLRAYEIPTDATELARLAHTMGFERGGEQGVKAFDRALAAHRVRTSQIFDAIFYPEEAPKELPNLASLLEIPPVSGAVHPVQRGEDRSTGGAIAQVLAPYGFRDLRTAHRHLVALATGHFPKIYGLSVYEHFLRLAPQLLEKVAESSDPDRALAHIESMVRSHGAPETLYELMADNPGLVDLMVALGGTSDFLSQLIVRHPELLDWLTSPLALLGTPGESDTPGTMAARAEAELPWLADERGFVAALHAFRNRELLRIGVRLVTALASQEATFEELTALADIVVERVHCWCRNALCALFGAPAASEAVIAMGKFGSGEMTFGSDLDWFHVYEADGTTAGGPQGRLSHHEFFGRLVAEMLRILSRPTDRGVLYRSDLRLRPEGHSAALSLPLTQYRHYLAQRAGTWERQALTRARVIARETAFGAELEKAITAEAYGGITTTEIKTMRATRRRMEREAASRERGRLNIKAGRGGLVDVEFVAQMLLMRYGAADPALRKPGGTLAMLEALARAGHLGDAEAAYLRRAYRTLRWVETRMRIGHDRTLDTVARTREGTAQLAAYMRGAPELERKGRTPEAALTTLEAQMSATRELLDRIFKREGAAPEATGAP